MINSEVWNEVVFWVLIHIFLEFMVSSSLGLQTSWECSGVASWNGFLLCKLSTGIFVVLLGCNDVMVHTEVWDEIILWMLVHVLLELMFSSSLSALSFVRVECWD